MNCKPVLGRWLVYHPDPYGEKDPTGAPMSKSTYLAEVSIAPIDTATAVHVHVTIDEHTDPAVCAGIKVARHVPLINEDEAPPASGGFLTWL